MKVTECFTNIFNLPQRKQDRTLSLWKHPLCFHGGTVHDTVRLYHQQQVSLSHGELRQQENWKFKGMLGLRVSCKAARFAVLHIHQLIPRQHGFPVTLCWIPQILKVKPLLLLWWLYWELPIGHISVSVPGLAGFKLNTKQGSFNLVWWPTTQLREWSLTYKLHIWAVNCMRSSCRGKKGVRGGRTRSGQKRFG